MKLGIGTVQFGMDYGISNREGQTPPDEVRKILDMAAAQGVRVLDTASLYGTSETVLGKTLRPDHVFDIVTKTPAFGTAAISDSDAQRLEQAFLQSLENMRQSHVYGLLMHNADDLLVEGGELLMEKMSLLKQRGLVKKVGASIYSGEQVDRLMEKYEMDLVQLPVNVLDQRLLTGGQLGRLKRRGVEVHARSIFLQGVLLMQAKDLSVHFESIRAHIASYHAYLIGHGLSLLEAALGFVAGLKEVDVAVCGINTCRQFDEIIAMAKPLSVSVSLENFAIDDPAILNPSQWKKCG